MNGKEIYDQILLLGARSSHDFEFQDNEVNGAINRAIDEVNRLFPVTESIQLLNYPIRPSAYYKGITVHKGGEDVVFNASDIKSLAFAVSGTGEAHVETIVKNEDGEESWESEKFFEWADLTKLEIKKLLVDSERMQNYYDNRGPVRLRFTGEYTYLIKDVSFYNELDGDIEDDVDIYSPWIAYDLKNGNYAGGNFLDFASLPIRFNEVSLNSPNDYRIEGSVIYLPADKQGTYELNYYKRPTHLNADSVGEEELDLDPRLHILVALKAAYYIYALVDEEAAASADAEYQKNLSLVMTTMPKLKTPKHFRDTRGW